MPASEGPPAPRGRAAARMAPVPRQERAVTVRRMRGGMFPRRRRLARPPVAGGAVRPATGQLGELEVGDDALGGRALGMAGEQGGGVLGCLVHDVLASGPTISVEVSS